VLTKELAAVAVALTRELCGLEALFDELWFVQEQDLLALVSDGRLGFLFCCRCSHATPQDVINFLPLTSHH